MPWLSTARHGGAKLPGVPLKRSGSSAGPLSFPVVSLCAFAATSLVPIVSQLVCNRILGHNVNDAGAVRWSGLPAAPAQSTVTLPGAGMLTMWARLEKLYR